jgi:hypothetical protein
MRRRPRPTRGLSRQGKKTLTYSRQLIINRNSDTYLNHIYMLTSPSLSIIKLLISLYMCVCVGVCVCVCVCVWVCTRVCVSSEKPAASFKVKSSEGNNRRLCRNVCTIYKIVWSETPKTTIRSLQTHLFYNHKSRVIKVRYIF